MKTLLRLCALVCLLSLASFGQDIWGSLPPAADCADGFAVTLKPQNPYLPQGGSFQLPGTYVCHTHVWYWQPPKVDSVSFFDATSMATATVGMLPLQTSNSGKWLTTNGTTSSWSAIAESAVTNLASDLAAKAPLASPTFTGTVAGITDTGITTAKGDGRVIYALSGQYSSDTDLLFDIITDTLTTGNVTIETGAGHGTLTLGTCQVLSGSASPESAVAAPVCSLYLRTDGGAGTTLYVKESGAGNTGWIGK